MDWWQAIILGIVQGLTEFLPISSSGHLIFAQELLGVDASSKSLDAFDVALHIGTLVAVFSYFRVDLVNMAKAGVTSIARREVRTPDQRLAWFVVLGTLPAIVAYKVFDSQIQSAQENFVLISLMLIFVCAYFFLADRFKGDGEIEGMSLKQAMVIGIGQACALIPGTSRSGATIATGMLVGLDRAAAARFSFLLSTPAILAATVLTVPDLAHAFEQDSGFIVATVLGMVAAAGSGYLAVSSLIKFLGGHALSWFAAYRIPAGLFFLWYFTR